MTAIEDVKQLVNEQLDLIEDELVRPVIEAILVEPFKQYRNSVGEDFLCWVVAVHTLSATDFETQFVYCEDEDSPFTGWGIVNGKDLEMGMDSGWFETLEDSFYESFAAIPLRIWNVVKRGASDDDRIVAANLTHDEATALIKKLNAEEGVHPLNHAKYSVEPRTKKWW